MKKLTLFVAALCATTMAVNAAETATVDLSAGKFTAGTKTDAAYITWKAVNDNITITQVKAKGSAVNGSYISAPRVYGGQYLSFVCATGYTITGINLTYSAGYYGNTLIAGTVVADDAVTDDQAAISRTLSTAEKNEDDGTHVFTTANAAGLDKIYIQNPSVSSGKQLRLTKIEISYIKAAATEPTIECANLDFGVVVAGAGESKELVVTGEKLTEAIVATLESSDNFTIAGDLTAAGGTLTVSVNASAVGVVSTKLALTSGTATKEVTISANAVEVTGAGTKENPFSVADVIKLANYGKEAWVEGYIIGALNSAGSKIDNTQASNLAIADAATEKVVANMVAVQLVGSSTPRKDLNVVDNSSVIGKKVKVYGSLESYLNLKGVKNTSDYVLETGPTTALENVEALEVYAENGRIYAAEGARIFTVSGIDVTEMNGQLNGIYIVKVGNQATKIAVK